MVCGPPSLPSSGWSRSTTSAVITFAMLGDRRGTIGAVNAEESDALHRERRLPLARPRQRRRPTAKRPSPRGRGRRHPGHRADKCEHEIRERGQHDHPHPRRPFDAGQMPRRPPLRRGQPPQRPQPHGSPHARKPSRSQCPPAPSARTGLQLNPHPLPLYHRPTGPATTPCRTQAIELRVRPTTADTIVGRTCARVDASPCSKAGDWPGPNTRGPIADHFGEDFLYNFKRLASLAAGRRRRGRRALASSRPRPRGRPSYDNAPPVAQPLTDRRRQGSPFTPGPAPAPPLPGCRQARSHARPVWLCRWRPVRARVSVPGHVSFSPRQRPDAVAVAVEDDRASLWQQRLTGPGGTSCTVGRDYDHRFVDADALAAERTQHESVALLHWGGLVRPSLVSPHL